jgi:hypothetical protein
VTPVRVLVVADEVDPSLGPDSLHELQPDLLVSCGDLPFDHLEYLTVASVPLLYVPGNHDPDVPARARGLAFTGSLPLRFGEANAELPGVAGGINVDGRVVDAAGLRVAGLGGSVRYKEGPNQHTQAQMRRRALRLELRCRLRRRARPASRHRVDLLVTHAPPLGVGDLAEDPAHAGFAAFHRLVRTLSPRLLVHGHIHPYGRVVPEMMIGETVVRNAVGAHLIEVEAGP